MLFRSDEISTYKMEVSRIDLKECILNACDNELYTYEDLLKEYYSLSFDERIDAAQQAMGEEWANGHPLIHAQIKYMFCVSGKAVTLISKRLCIDSEDIFNKFIAVSKNPEICGLSSDAALYHRDYGLGAGALYIMLHYILTDDSAKSNSSFSPLHFNICSPISVRVVLSKGLELPANIQA